MMKRYLVALLTMTLAAVPSLAQKYVKYFDTYDALVAANPNDLSNTAVVKAITLGNADEGGTFYYYPTANDATNTTTIFKPTNFSGRWIRVGGGGGTGTGSSGVVTNMDAVTFTNIADVIYMRLGTGFDTNGATGLLDTKETTSNILWVDATTGNNTTAVRGRQDRPYLTVQAAVSACQSGDTIQLLPGTYSVTPTLVITDTPLYGAPIAITNRNNIMLRGSGRDNTIISATGQGNVVLLYGVNGFTMQDLQIKGSVNNGNGGNAYYALVLCEGTNSNVTIKDCVLRDSGEHGIADLYNTVGTTGARISNVNFYNIGNTNHPGLIWDGACLASLANVTMENCYADGFVRFFEAERTPVGAGLGQMIVSGNLTTNMWNYGQAVTIFPTHHDDDCQQHLLRKNWGSQSGWNVHQWRAKDCNNWEPSQKHHRWSWHQCFSRFKQSYICSHCEQHG
jgi:hypothetical protein